ncbi:hypothetical protein [Paractinoplanes atraurantiacus]|nr:hypothetical protein [Actinoplanes atraurantiacus]
MFGMTRPVLLSPHVPPEAASAYETRRFYLKKSKRKSAPLRRAFIQRPPGSTPRVGPLAAFVRRGDIRALDAYLYLVAITSGDLEGVGWSYTLDSNIWARAFGATDRASSSSALTAVVRILNRLQERKLLEWKRVRPRSSEITVTLLKEDGSGEPYTRPGRANLDPYINLPFGYWYDEWDQRLSLPATAMLLVLSAEFKSTALPAHRVDEWYGWSADTAERGFAELERYNLMTQQRVTRKAPNAPVGWTAENRYTLQRPFRHRKRSAASAKSAAAVTSDATPALQGLVDAVPIVPVPAGFEQSWTGLPKLDA